MQQSPDSDASPVLKIGAVVLRADDAVLILQPIPKNPGEVPHFVLPRGSRQYYDGQAWHDARDEVTGRQYADTLEPLERGFAREVEEEAGVDAAMLARAQVRELGTLPFQSRSKGIYPIHWFVVRLSDAHAASIVTRTPMDAMTTRWASLTEIRAMAAAGEFSAGYVPVIEVALDSPSPSAV